MVCGWMVSNFEWYRGEEGHRKSAWIISLMQWTEKWVGGKQQQMGWNGIRKSSGLAIYLSGIYLLRFEAVFTCACGWTFNLITCTFMHFSRPAFWMKLWMHGFSGWSHKALTVSHQPSSGFYTLHLRRSLFLYISGYLWAAILLSDQSNRQSILDWMSFKYEPEDSLCRSQHRS